MFIFIVQSAHNSPLSKFITESIQFALQLHILITWTMAQRSYN